MKSKSREAFLLVFSDLNNEVRIIYLDALWTDHKIDTDHLRLGVTQDTTVLGLYEPLELNGLTHFDLSNLILAEINDLLTLMLLAGLMRLAPHRLEVAQDLSTTL
jgi:hypothetical protein